MKRLSALLFAFAVSLPVHPPVALAAINPASFQSVASDLVLLREVARVVHTSGTDATRLRRVTIVAEVLDGRRFQNAQVGDTIVIDYTVDLTARERAATAHAQRQGQMPGPQFMGEPDPPRLDDQGRFWAHLARAGGRLGNVNRYAGAVVGIGDLALTGKVFVPVAGPYSFSPPM